MAITTPELSRSDSVVNELLVFEVGPERKRIISCNESAFIKTATLSRWNRPDRDSIDLTDEALSDFSIFAHWIHDGTILFKLSRQKHPIIYNFGESRNSDPKLEQIDSRLISAYILGQKLLAPRFQDAVLSALATRLRHAGSKVISATNVSLAYDNTHETSPLRRFMVAVFLESSYDTNVGKTYHHEFIAELALVQAQRDLYTSFPFLPSPRPYPHPIDIICRFDHHGSEKKFGSCRGGLKTC
ncbi:hypothetical protein BDV97DRAFT_343194 [Delphinella strobiligena]|nr:hypothetical protein BDV97DRAFT_343194 [Delphinella strobiligena]